MQAKTDSLETPVRYFKGVGPKKCEYLSRLGISTVRDMLYYLPSRYEDRSTFSPIKEVKPGERQTIRGNVITMRTRSTKRGMAVFEIVIGDKTGFINAVWFNQPFLSKFFKPGQEVILYGKAELYDRLQINHPEYEIVEEEESSIHIGRIVPVYHLTSQITQRYLRSLVNMALVKYARYVPERLPTYIRARQKLADIRFAVNNIHFPSNFDALDRAYKRIVFEEFFILQLALAIKRAGLKVEGRGLIHMVEGELAKAFMRTIPFELTKAQKDAIRDIERDMSSTKPMTRLLEGDVGSGKTIVAAYALVLTVQNGLQGVIMAPTEVLARQHYLVLTKLLMPLGVSVAFLARGISREDRGKVLTEIREGGLDVIVGTHAVIQEGVEFKKLGLAVIDEQHKFGVEQRASLRQKGHDPHLLVMTATPIPRTLALTVYGDLDISVIRELPKGRKPIATYWVEEVKREKVYNFVKDEVAKGRQAYIVYPLIESSDRVASKSAEEMYEKLSREVFRGNRVGLIHGRMSAKEKDKVMKDFKSGKLDILVATVVIEVGIDIQNASIMVIENAERFGLAQLHQLRGRIGRGEHESYCILLADPKSDIARKRLAVIEDTVDGFEIAEEDLSLRGPGEFFGTSQHGLPEIRFGNLVKDFGIMNLAREEAMALVARDPGFAEEHHQKLREALAHRFRGKVDMLY